MIVLVCSIQTSPADCSRDTAIDVMTFPPTPGTMCLFAGEAAVARTALRPGPRQYLKVDCAREREVLPPSADRYR